MPWLARRCRELAQRVHPAQTSRTIAGCFTEEGPHLRAIAAVFDGYVEQMLRVSSTCLVRIDYNRYSVPAHLAGRVVSVRTTAERIRIVADGELVADHGRRFGRDQLICDPWHYLPVLEKKPGALRNSAPFQQWDLPTPIQQVRDRILKQPKGDRAFVELLLLAREVGLEALAIACELTLETGIVTAAMVTNELRRLSALPRPADLDLPQHPPLQLAPVADCNRYDHLRGGAYVH